MTSAFVARFPENPNIQTRDMVIWSRHPARRLGGMRRKSAYRAPRQQVTRSRTMLLLCLCAGLGLAAHSHLDGLTLLLVVVMLVAVTLGVGGPSASRPQRLETARPASGRAIHAQ